MVTKEKLISNVMRDRLGTILIWRGVFTWAPLIFLRAIAEESLLVIS